MNYYYQCEYCGNDIDDTDFCGHNSKIHNWCSECCAQNYQYDYSGKEWMI